ncbi:unnamed protein product [Paramecium pentaurelia]|uniref:Uncharacterized protein n=1 Tax=Paramecium pentaurelia TaxID=43138 RepID=A0A8S1UVA5_9CILI|nr:unnamed protein product [Paramecium pentaurelia]
MYQFRSSLYYEPSDNGSVRSVQVGNQKQDQLKYLTDQLQAVITFNEKLEKDFNQLKSQNHQLKQISIEREKQQKEIYQSNQKSINKLHVLLSENKKLQEIVVSTNKHLKLANTRVQQFQNENIILKQSIQQLEDYHLEEMKKRATELEDHYSLMQNIVTELTNQVSQLCVEKQQLQKELDQFSTSQQH